MRVLELELRVLESPPAVLESASAVLEAAPGRKVVRASFTALSGPSRELKPRRTCSFLLVPARNDKKPTTHGTATDLSEG